MNEKKSNKKQQIDYLSDVIDAVRQMDAKKRVKENFTEERKKALSAIKLANTVNGKGYISISKARELIQVMNVNKKIRIIARAEKEAIKAAKRAQKAKSKKKPKKIAKKKNDEKE